jgi:hypothetical protein
VIDAALRALCRAGAAQSRAGRVPATRARSRRRSRRSCSRSRRRRWTHAVEGHERGRLVASPRACPIAYARTARAADVIALFAQRVAAWARIEAGG